MYKLMGKNDIMHLETILRKSDNAFIPEDPGNRDYQEYLAWLAEGNEPEPADE